MKVLFISRKKRDGFGGLSRFAIELQNHLPVTSYLLSPDSLMPLLKLPLLKVDLVYLGDATLLPLGIALKFLLRKPLILTAHGLDLTYQNFFYQLMLKRLLPRVDCLVLDSTSSIRLLKEFFVESDKICVINPGVSISHLTNPRAMNLPKSNDKIVLLTVGNLVKRKGQAWFISNVFIKLPQKFIFIIVGDGPEIYSIRSLIQKLSLQDRVYLLGKLSHDELADVFRKTDIYVSPNQEISGNFEGFGIASGEAAAMGLPVIASRVDGIPEAIKHRKNGWLVSSRPADFIKAIRRLEDPLLRKMSGQKAEQFTLKNYSWEKAANKYFKTFQEAVGKN